MKRGELLRDGKITLSDLVDQRLRPLTLDQLEELSRLQRELEEMDSDLAEHRRRLQELESQAAPPAAQPVTAKPPEEIMKAFQDLTEQMLDVQTGIKEPKRRRKEETTTDDATPGGAAQDGATPPPAPLATAAEDPPLTPILTAMKELTDQFHTWATAAAAGATAPMET